MKKTILVVILTTLGAFVSLKAQVGIGQEVPQATLHVDGNNTATDPSGVIVPRFTASALNDKNAAYGAAQNGTIVFVTSGTGVAATKTSEITGTGFYYYNSTTSKWTAVGGGAPNFQVQKTRIHTGNSAITWAADDYSVVTTGMGGASVLLLPAAASLPLNSVRCVSNNGTGVVGWSPSATAGSTRPLSSLPTGISSASGFCFVVADNGGTPVWAILSGR